MRRDPLDHPRDLPNRDGEHYEVGPGDGRRRIFERLPHAPQRYRLRAVTPIVIGPSDLFCQATSATGKPHATADQAETNDGNTLKQRDAT
jgi:hypothetical protein